MKDAALLQLVGSTAQCQQAAARLLLPNRGSNPSIERTHNGGAQCPAPSRVVTPLCAAHVKRWASYPSSTLPHRVTSMLRSVALVLLCLVSGSPSVLAQSKEPWETGIENLMVVLRESAGANKLDEVLKPIGKGKVKLADGKEIELDTGWFDYIGDMHIRFVFDGPHSMRGATPADLERLKLTPEQAVGVAVANIKRVYGKPTATPWNDLLQVKGKSPDLDSSYFLDREFWQALLKQHPEGIVVSVAKRGGLVYTPLSNARAVEGLRRSVAYLHSSSERLRVSSALYLFKDDRWSVFQAPVKQ